MTISEPHKVWQTGNWPKEPRKSEKNIPKLDLEISSMYLIPSYFVQKEPG